MVSAIKEISIARGHDPRDFALVAYGGAGPMHAALLADELEMTRVVVPPAPGNFSAFGSLISDLRRDYVQTRLVRTRSGDDAAVSRVFAELEQAARADLRAEGLADPDITLVRALGMRYVGQSWELLVRAEAETPVTLAALEAAFHRAHEQRYGHATPREAEIVNFRLTGVGAVPKPAPARWTLGGALAQAQRTEREVTFDRAPRRVPVYRRERLPGAVPITGPAVVEEMGSTTIIPPGWVAVVGGWGELVLERREDR
jgi:N-methylhydantoinase A